MVLLGQDMISAQAHSQQQYFAPRTTAGGLGTGEGGSTTGRPAGSKVYVGNLNCEVSEDSLRDFFQENRVPASFIHKMVVKKGFAFVELIDQSSAELTIKNCNGKPFMSTVVRVEPAIQNSENYSRFQSAKLVQLLVSNCNPTMTREELREMIIQSRANSMSIEEVRSLVPGSISFVVRVASMRAAQNIVNEWSNKIVSGCRIQINIMDEKFSDGAGDRASSFPPSYRSASYNSGMNEEGYSSERADLDALDLPLRILVPNEFIGAIIGRGGATIRAISKGTGARLDIFRHYNRNYDLPEKPVSITGPHEKVTQACKKILEIVAQEADHQRDRRGDIALKLFAPNSVIGRIIGKEGSVIKEIMELTQTKIHISNQPEFMEESSGSRRSNQRIVTVRGSIDGMSQAEAILSEKLRQAYCDGKVRDRDLDFGTLFGYPGNASNRMVNPREHTYFMSNSGPSNFSYEPRTRNSYPMGTNGPRAGFPMLMSPRNEGVSLSRPETAFMYIPDESVGALIGRKGSSIREIIHASGASIKVLDGVVNINDFPCRRVVIHGGIQSLFLAEYLIYQRVVDEGNQSIANLDDGQLTVEMTVPTEVVGRLIGKGGANIKEIQRQNFCRIKFLTEPDPSIPPPMDGETYVRITGTSDAFLFAQKKIRALLVKAMSKAFTHSNNGSRNEAPEEEGPTHCHETSDLQSLQ